METIRDVVIRVRMQLVDDKSLKAGAQKLGAEVDKALAGATKRFSENVQRAGAGEREKVRMMDVIRRQDEARERSLIKQQEYERQITNEILKQQASRRVVSPGRPGVPGDSNTGGIFDNLTLMGGKGAAGKLLGAAGFALSLPQIIKGVYDLVGGSIDTVGAEFGKNPFRDEKTITHSVAKTLDSFERTVLRAFVKNPADYRTAFGKELGIPDNFSPGKLRILSPDVGEQNRQGDIQRKSQEYINVLQRQIDATQALVETQFKLRDIDIDLIRQRDKGISGATGVEKEIARKGAARISAVGIEGLTKEQLEIVKGSPILGPEFEQYRNRKYAQGLSKQDRELAEAVSNAFGNKAREDAAKAAAGATFGIDQKIAVTMSIQDFDKITKELKDKLLPEIVKLNQAVLAEVRIELDRRQARQRAGTDHGF